MKYKTKGGISPQGKIKIYFASHPSDLVLLDRICIDIWKHRDVVVCYKDREDDPVNKDDFLLMQLMVIPVTSRLLEDSNCSVYEEFEFFYQHNLPVLPLMFERGLVSLYTQKFHSIQFLSVISTDSTELPFEERMRYTLDILLPDEEIVEKVRNAFAAYIFLSYRKKDREKAQELMQMIHRIPEYRDVAIWYDEFIAGSEDFNESITRALKKCDFFALMITPNLINEKNYVKEIEYPMALRENKEILPVEVMDTNREELSRQFENIYNVVKAVDGEFEVYMQEKYKKLAFVRKEGHPEHDYLIGLAYLNGIDVETNYVLAERLISEAADAGVVEAMGELVNMLYYGKGVACNREDAVRVQKRKIEAVGRKNELLSLLKEIERLGSMYIDMRKTEEAEKTYEELRKLANSETSASSTDIEVLTLIVADSWLKTGRVRELKCNVKEAFSAYQAAMGEIALSMVSLIYSLPKNSPYIQEINTLQASMLSDIEIEEDKLYSAVKSFLSAYKGDKEKAALILHMSNMKCGSMLMRTRKVELALKKYKNAEAIAKILVEMNDNEENRRRICKSIVEVALGCISTRKYSDVEDKTKAGLEIAERLYKEIGDTEDVHICKQYYDCLGKYYKTTSEWEQALSYYQKSYEICQKQLEKENSIETKLDMLDTCINMGMLMYETEIYLESKEYFQRGFDICSSLEGKTNEPEYQYGFIRLSLSYGDLLIILGDKKGALLSYTNGLEKIEELFFSSKDLEALYIATQYYRKRAELEYDYGNREKSCEQYWKGLFLTALFKGEGDSDSTILHKQYEVRVEALEKELLGQNRQEYHAHCMEMISRYSNDANGKRTAYGSKHLLNKEVISAEAIGYAADMSRLLYICETGLLQNMQGTEVINACVNAYTRLAELEAFFGFEKVAETDYEKAINLAERNLSLKVLPTLILTCEKAIQFKKRYHESEDIEKYHEIIEKAAERIAAESCSDEAFLALANWYSKKGHMEKDCSTKQGYYQRAFDIASRIWEKVRGDKQSPLLKDWYDRLDKFERENEVIELIFGQDNRKANGLLRQWFSTIEPREKEKMYRDLDRYLLQDETGHSLSEICDCLGKLYEQCGTVEEAQKMVKIKEYIEKELEKENEYFWYWMKLCQAKHLWEI